MNATEWLDVTDIEWAADSNAAGVDAAVVTRADARCDAACAAGASALDVSEARTLVRALALHRSAMLAEARAEPVSTAMQAASAESLAERLQDIAPDLAEDLLTVAAEWATAVRYAEAERLAERLLVRLR